MIYQFQSCISAENKTVIQKDACIVHSSSIYNRPRHGSNPSAFFFFFFTFEDLDILALFEFSYPITVFPFLMFSYPFNGIPPKSFSVVILIGPFPVILAATPWGMAYLQLTHFYLSLLSKVCRGRKGCLGKAGARRGSPPSQLEGTSKGRISVQRDMLVLEEVQVGMRGKKARHARCGPLHSAQGHKPLQ